MRSSIAVVARVVPVVLRAQARELAGIPVEHERDALRVSGTQQRERLGRQQARIDERDVRRARVERVVAQRRRASVA